VQLTLAVSGFVALAVDECALGCDVVEDEDCAWEIVGEGRRSEVRTIAWTNCCERHFKCMGYS
jgi:hypothetical protein